MLLPRNSCFFNLGTTNTFRSSSSAILDRWGTNIQNIEKSARKIYKPDNSKVLLQCDQKGAEALIVAYLCKHGRYRDLFLHNISPHTYLASQMFNDRLEKENPQLDWNGIKSLEPKVIGQHSQWKDIAKFIKSTDDWPTEKRYYYFAKQTNHCVDNQTEVLTENGWINVDSYNGIEQIAIWNPKDESIFFESPSKWYSYDYEGDMIKLVGSELSQCVTKEHKVCYSSNGKFLFDKAQNLVESARIPLCGYYVGGNEDISIDEAKFICATQADAHIQSKHIIRFRFRKFRKIKRIKKIINALKLPYKERLDIDGATTIIVYHCKKYVDIFKGIKIWDSWLLKWPKASLETLANELKYWDGSLSESYQHKREQYSSKYLSNLEWVKTILHLVGKQGTIDKNTYNSGAYKLGINQRKLGRVNVKKLIAYSGQVYCPRVSTGYFLIRRKGKISITGNSANYGIRPPKFRMNVLEKSNGKVYISKYDSEYFLSFYRTLYLEIPEWNYETIKILQKSRTLYNLFGHPREFNGDLDKDETYREAHAFVPQSTVGEITHVAFRDLQSYIEQNKKDWDILTNTHDSYLVQCPDDVQEIKECATKMSEYMNQHLTNFRGEKFQMASDIAVGYNWSPHHPIKNPSGLKEYLQT